MKVPLLCIKYLKNTPRFGYSFFITYLLKLGHLCHVKLKQAGMKAELHLPDLQFKDNTENHEVVKSLMLHGHDLDVEFSVVTGLLVTWRDRGLRDQAEQGRRS